MSFLGTMTAKLGAGGRKAVDFKLWKGKEKSGSWETKKKAILTKTRSTNSISIRLNRILQMFTAKSNENVSRRMQGHKLSCPNC